MYSVVIVDDEQIIREGLKKLVDEEADGFTVVKCFGDGVEAVEYISNNKTDVLLTDIRMSRMSGLELAKTVRDISPETKIVILTGYKEFEYARKAIEYGVKFFLLKPTDFSEVLDVFEKLKLILDNDVGNKEQKEKYKEMVEFLQEEMIEDIIMGAINQKEKIASKMKVLDLVMPIETAPCATIRICITNYVDFIRDKWFYGKDGMYTVIQNFLRARSDKVKFYTIYCSNEDIRLIALSGIECNADEFNRILLNILKDTKEDIKSTLGVDLTFEVDNIFKSIIEFSKKGLIKEFNEEQLKLLYGHISRGNIEEANNIYKKLISSGLMKTHYIEKMIIDMVKHFENMGITLPAAVQDHYSRIINNQFSQNEIEDLAWSIIKCLSVTASDIQNNYANNIISRAKQFVEDNYMKDISLQDAADYVFLSTKYFSRFFKQQTGENFSDYLIKVRMSHAVQLLIQGMKVEEVSDKVGYKYPKYFALVFKKYAGCTPKEYMRFNAYQKRTFINKIE